MSTEAAGLRAIREKVEAGQRQPVQLADVEEARKLAEQALKINPNLPEALNLRADVHLAQAEANRDTARGARLARSRRPVHRDDDGAAHCVLPLLDVSPAVANPTCG